ncbi:MAG: TonB-dependent receptor plug domain-containing protein [Bacteroidota bacterium]
MPQSIQVVPQEILKDQQVTRLDEALRNVSGVIGNSSEGGGFQFSIRGFERARTMKDGFSQSPSDALGSSGILTLPETANLERIEVLKGPASILYGEVQPGGTINLVTKKPTSEPLYEAELQIGSRGFVQPRIDFSDALTPDKNVRYRLNALIQNDEGFRDFDQNIQRQFIKEGRS